MKQIPFKEREIIDMGAGYKLATLGQGSTVRIHCPDGSYLIVTPRMYYEPYEQMARALAAEREKYKSAFREIKEHLLWSAAPTSEVSRLLSICDGILNDE